MSVLRVLGELERIGDLALRVVKLAPDWELLPSGEPETFDILAVHGRHARSGQYRTALRAWSAQDLRLADELAGSAGRWRPPPSSCIARAPAARGSRRRAVRGPYA